jgi:hypothetical protein
MKYKTSYGFCCTKCGYEFEFGAVSRKQAQKIINRRGLSCLCHEITCYKNHELVIIQRAEER